MLTNTITLLLTLLLTLLPNLVASTDDFDRAAPAAPAFAQSITLQQWPLSASQPSPLGQIGYDPRTRRGKYFSLPGRDGRRGGERELVRVGVQNKAGGWVGVVVDSEALDQAKYNPMITLRLDNSGKVWHVEFAATTDKTQPPQVILLPTTEAGTRPMLNKPITVGADGKIPQPPVEKTLLQKYWWVLLAGVILLMGGGGAAE